jgi:hypothetical protein
VKHREGIRVGNRREFRLEDEMKARTRMIQRWHPLLIVALCVLVLTAFAVKDGLKPSIVGKVNGDYRIVTAEGEVYDVAENGPGDEMVLHIGKIVKVRGKIRDEMGTKVIIVSTYKVIGG